MKPATKQTTNRKKTDLENNSSLPLHPLTSPHPSTEEKVEGEREGGKREEKEKKKKTKTIKTNSALSSLFDYSHQNQVQEVKGKTRNEQENNKKESEEEGKERNVEEQREEE